MKRVSGSGNWDGKAWLGRLRLPRWARLEPALALLLVATFAAILWQDRILDRTLSVSPGAMDGHRSSYAFSDAEQGGSSRASVDPANPLRWSCTLGSRSNYPFCGFGIRFDEQDGNRGLDLSEMESLTLDLTYRGPGRTLTLYLKNFDPRYSRPGNPETDKFNRVDIAVRPGRQLIRVKADDFGVPDWWTVQNRIPQALAKPQLDHVVALELMVGAGSPNGAYRQTLHGVTFSSPTISRSLWQTSIALFWAGLMALLLIHRRRQEQAGHRARQEGWRKTLDSIPQMVWSSSADGDEYLNDQWTEFTGVRLGSDVDLKRIDLVHPEDRDRVWARWTHSLETGEPYECEYRLLHHSGDYRWVLSRGMPDGDASGPRRWYGTGTDIHDRVMAAQALDASERLNRGIIDAIPDRVSLLDLEGRCIFANKPARALGKAGGSDGRDGAELLAGVPGEARGRAMAAFNRARTGKLGRFSFRAVDASWWDVVLAPVPDRQGHPFRIVMASRDISEQKAAEEQAQWTASHDSLTRLANRMVLQKRVDAAIDGGTPFALLLFDIDDFKLINDTAGHDAGDALLCAFGARLCEATRADDTVARLGGDEFAVILNGQEAGEPLDAALRSIIETLRQPCIHNGRVFDCKASIGVSLFPRDASTRTRLLKNADVALYAAKHAGKGNAKLFKPDMRAELQKRGAMSNMAREALRQGRITPHYQPKLDLRSGALDGFEALLRWRHPRKGIQSPAVIAAAFEDLTLAAEMSDAMIEGVIRDICIWRDEGIPFGHVAINAAAAEFRREDFAERLLERLAASGIAPDAIQVEVTETVFLGRGASCVERALKTLSEAGVGIALDDFGTGYASLAHLRQFPVDIIKIDRSFVHELQQQRDNAPIIDAVINLGRSLGIKVVAEGIETALQHHFLVSRGCDYGQGHLYSAAVPAAEAAAFARAPTDLSQAAA